MDTPEDSKVLHDFAATFYGDDWLEKLTVAINGYRSRDSVKPIPSSRVREWAEGRQRPPVWVLMLAADIAASGAGEDSELEQRYKALLKRLNEVLLNAEEVDWDGDRLRIIIVDPEDDLQSEMINTRPSSPVTIGNGVTVTWEVPLAKSLNIPDTIVLAFEISKEVGIPIIAHTVAQWLIELFHFPKKRARALTINRRECHFEHGQVVKVIEETIKQDSH